MNFDWQLSVALFVVGLAVLYVLRKAWKSLRGKSSGCGSGCGSCSTAKPGQPAAQLVTLREAKETSPRP